MNDYTDFRAAVEAYLDANFSTVPLVYENANLEVINEEHVELVDQGVEDNQRLEIGGSAHMVSGILVAQIFTKANTGTEKARQVAADLDAVIRSSNIGIDFDMPTLTSVGLADGSDLFQHNLSFPYQYFYGQIDNNC